MSEPPGQVSSVVPVGTDGAEMTVISAAREVEQGARSVLLLAAGLFRLDVVPHDDTTQAIVRNLSPSTRADLRLEAVPGEASVLGAPGEIAAPPTGRFGGEIVLVEEDGEERVAATILVGSVCHLDRGLTSFTAQATVS